MLGAPFAVAVAIRAARALEAVVADQLDDGRMGGNRPEANESRVFKAIEDRDDVGMSAHYQ